MTDRWVPHIDDRVREYYDRVDLRLAIGIAQDLVDEWEYEQDAHGYCHVRPVWVRLLEGVAMVDQKAAERIPDGPCVKCGDLNVVLRFIAAKTRHHSLVCVSESASREHFHHYCQRCGTGWVTTNMLDGEGAKP